MENINVKEYKDFIAKSKRLTQEEAEIALKSLLDFIKSKNQSNGKQKA